MEFKNQGYIALVSVVIISVLLISITTALNLSGFLGRANILDSEYKGISRRLAFACAEQALLDLAKGALSPRRLEVGAEHCDIISANQTGGTWIIMTQASTTLRQDYRAVTTLRIEALKNGNDILISQWQECPTLASCP